MENYYEPVYNNSFEENKRPGFLTFLCVLTFIGSGISLLSSLITPFFAPTFMDILYESPIASDPKSMEAFEKILNTPTWHFYLTALFCATSILGAIYMLKMKKIGFHIYVISQLIIFGIGQFLVGNMSKPNYFDLFTTVLFIGLYAIFYKKFTDLDAEEPELES
jgi:hypothetical protein